MRLIGLAIALFLFMGVTIAALPGLFQIYQIYHDPETTKKGLNESANIYFSYELTRTTPEKPNELNLTVTVENDNDRDIPITRTKLICTEQVSALSGDQGFTAEEDSYGEKVLSYDPPMIFKAQTTATYNLLITTATKTDFSCQLVYLNLLQNFTTGFTFTVLAEALTSP